MTNIQVIIDSTANAQPQWLSEYPAVHVVPLTVEMADKEYAENQLSAEQLFALMKEQQVHPKTSQPPPGVFQQLYEQLLVLDGDIIVITLAEALSGTVRSAELARTLCSAPQRIHVIDSATTAIGMVKMAEEVVAAARDNQTVPEILSQLARIVAATHTYFVPGTLEFLHKGGRIGNAAALFGAILQIRPVLYLVDGKVTVLEKVRTRSRAVDRMLTEVTHFKSLAYLGVVEITAAEDAQKAVQQLGKIFPQVPVSVSSCGSVLAAHLGPGLIGVVLQEEL